MISFLARRLFLGRYRTIHAANPAQDLFGNIPSCRATCTVPVTRRIEVASTTVPLVPHCVRDEKGVVTALSRCCLSPEGNEHKHGPAVVCDRRYTDAWFKDISAADVSSALRDHA
jgi:hypothetical protein